MEKTYDIFISHSSTDSGLSMEITTYLEKMGFTCWIAPRDINKSAGRSYAESIINGIRTSAMMLVVFSENVNHSVYVKNEIERAVHYKLPILPLKIDAAEPSAALELFLSPLHWLVVKGKYLEDYNQQLAYNCRQLIGDDRPPRETVSHDHENDYASIPAGKGKDLQSPESHKHQGSELGQTVLSKKYQPLMQIKSRKQLGIWAGAIISILIALIVALNIAKTKPTLSNKNLKEIKPQVPLKMPLTDSTILSAVKKDGKWGWINRKGAVVIPLNYDSVQPFSQGLAMVMLKGKWGFCNRKNKLIGPAIYDEAFNFSNNRAAVCWGEKWRFINKAGKEVITTDYNLVSSFSEGLAYVIDDKEKYYIDTTGRVVIRLGMVDDAGDFHEGYTTVTTNHNMERFIDSKGNRASPEQVNIYLGNIGFREGMTSASDGPNYGFIDRNWKLSIPLRYDITMNFFEGTAPVRKNGKWGHIDKSGKIVIDLLYDNTSNFSEGNAAVLKENKWAYIDRAGKMLTGFDYEFTSPFSYGIAAVVKNGKCFFVNNKGDQVIKGIYQEAFPFVDINKTLTEFNNISVFHQLIQP